MSTGSSRRLLVEGWRFIPHSYGLVNQFQLLELSRQRELDLAHHDIPYALPQWKPMAGLFPSTAEAQLRSIRTADSSDAFDAVYRIHVPYDFRASSRAPRTFIFAVTEFGVLQTSTVAGSQPLGTLFRDSRVTLITPSEWSRQGLIRSGAAAERIAIVPHGVDTTIFKPASVSERNSARARLGLNGFVFLNTGAMSDNKGISLLLKAIAVVSDKFPDIRLLLKGMDSIYGSNRLLDQAASQLSQAEIARVQPRLRYIGRSVSFTELAEFYRASDAYVTPYVAEGFNLPALEAVASGLPLICTQGGPTDAFARDEFAMRIQSSDMSMRLTSGQQGLGRWPSLDHLIELMIRVVQDDLIGSQARQAGPAFVADQFTWAIAVRRLMTILFPGAPTT